MRNLPPMSKKDYSNNVLTKVKMGIKHIVFKVQTLTCCDNHVQLNNFSNLEHVMKNFFFHYHYMLKSCNVELCYCH